MTDPWDAFPDASPAPEAAQGRAAAQGDAWSAFPDAGPPMKKRESGGSVEEAQLALAPPVAPQAQPRPAGIPMRSESNPFGDNVQLSARRLQPGEQPPTGAVKGPDGNYYQHVEPGPVQIMPGVTLKGPALAEYAKQSAASQQAASDPVLGRALGWGNTYSYGLFPAIEAGLAAGGRGIGNLLGDQSGISMADQYAATKLASQDALRFAGKRYPVSNAIGSGVGFVTAPGAVEGGKFVATGAGTAARMGRSALVGSAMGAANGAGSSAPGDEVAGAVGGAAVGGGVGLVAPPLIGAGARMTAPIRRPVQNFLAESLSKIGAPKWLTPQVVPQPVKAPKIAPALDPILPAGEDNSAVAQRLQDGSLPVAAGNPYLTQLGEMLGNTAGPGGMAVRQAAQERMAAQPADILSAVSEHLGVDPETAKAGVDELVQRGQDEAAPLYDAIRAQPGPVWNSDLARLAQRPAIKKALGMVGNDMLNAGEDPFVAGIKLDPNTGFGHLVDDSGQLVTQQLPTAATWDRVYKAMGRSIERNPITSAPLPDSVSSGNAGIRAATGDLRGALAGTDSTPGAIPGYSDALSKAGDYLSVRNAYDRAGAAWTPNTDKFSRFWGSLSTPAEQNAARARIAQKLVEDFDAGRLKPGQFNRPGLQENMQTAFGDRAGPFLDSVEQMQGEREALGQITGNSRTALRADLQQRYAAAAKKGFNTGNAAEWAGVAALAAHNPITAIGTIPLKLAKDAAQKGAKAAAMPWDNPKLSEQLGRVLADPQAMLDYMEQSRYAKAAQDALNAHMTGATRLAPVLSRAVTPPIKRAANG